MNTAKEYTFSYEIKKPVLLIRALDMFRIISIAYLHLEINSLDRQIYKFSFQWHCGECLIKQVRRYAARSSTRLTTRLNSVKRLNSKPSGEREHSPYSGNGRVYSHSGACNGEFGGAAVVCNQCLFDCTESLFAEKERSVVALQQTSLLLRGFPANFSNLTRYAPLLFIFTIKYNHFLRI